MDLRTYLNQATRGEAARVARDVGVHPVMVSQWASGRKEVPVDRSAPLERATGAAVRRWELRPTDWFVHWPELVGTEGAPEIPSEEEVQRAA